MFCDSALHNGAKSAYDLSAEVSEKYLPPTISISEAEAPFALQNASSGLIHTVPPCLAIWIVPLPW